MAVGINGGTGGTGGGKSGGKGFDRGFGGGKGYKDGGFGGGFGGGKGFKDSGFGGGFGGGKGFDDGKGKGKGKRKPQANTVFVGGLTWNTSDDMLKAHFQDCGEIIYCAIMRERDTGRSRGMGKVEFASQDAMDYAINSLNQTDLDGRTINVREF